MTKRDLDARGGVNKEERSKTPRKGTVAWCRALPLVCSSRTIEGLFKLIAEHLCVDRKVLSLYDGGECTVSYLLRSDGGRTMGIRVLRSRAGGNWQARSFREEPENNLWRGVRISKECYEEWA